VSVLVADAVTAAAGDEPRCPGCAAPAADDQRFCLSCGLRLTPDELRLAALPLLATPAASDLAALAAPAGPAFRQPVVRSAAITAVVVLALGIAIGATIGPAAVDETAAAQRGALVVVTTPPAAAPAPVTSGSAGTTAPLRPDSSRKGAVVGEGEATAPAPPQAPAPQAPRPSTPRADDPPAPATPPPGSRALAGTVAAVAADGEGFVLAARDGSLLHVHASGCGVAPGDNLHLRARRLANGTWSADRVRRVAAAESMRVAGTVVWSDPATGRYALGARGATLLVTVPSTPAPADPPATTPAPPAAPAPPAVGAQLRVRLQPVAARDGQPAALAEQARRAAPAPADPAAPVPPLELSGLVQSTDSQARRLVLALDAGAQPPLTIALSVPPAIDLTRLLPAQQLAVTATAAADGALTLTGLSPDGDALAADDTTALQGDQAPSAPPAGADPTSSTATTCTVLDAPARSADLRTFTSPPPDRNERSHTRS